MNVGLQFTIADEYFRSGHYSLQRQNLNPEEKSRALENLQISKETFQLCLDSGSPDLNDRLRESIEKRISKIRELLVGAELRGLVFEEEE